MLRLMLLRPYRCWSCDCRHYAYLFLRKSRNSRTYASTLATIAVQIPKAITVLPMLLLVPWALASTGSDLMLMALTFSTPARVTASLHEMAPFGQPKPVAQATIPEGSNIVLAAALPWQVGPSGSAQEKPTDKPELFPSRPAPAEKEALGSLTSSGDVTLNGAKVPQLATIYSEDTLQTGTDGNALIQVKGKGSIQVYPGSRVSLPNSSRFIAQLELGQISFRPLGLVKGFNVRVGNFVVAPTPDSPQATASVERDASGLIRVKAVQGSVDIAELEGSQTVLLQNGQEISVASDGSLGGVSPSQPNPTKLARSGGGHTPIILLGVGAAAAAGAAVGLSGSGSTPSPSVSPFTL